jgi:hypothetical protein
VQSEIGASEPALRARVAFSSRAGLARSAIAWLPAQLDVVASLYFSLFSIVLRIVFPLIPIVPALAVFLLVAQGVAL